MMKLMVDLQGMNHVLHLFQILNSPFFFWRGAGKYSTKSHHGHFEFCHRGLIHFLQKLKYVVQPMQLTTHLSMMHWVGSYYKKFHSISKLR